MPDPKRIDRSKAVHQSLSWPPVGPYQGALPYLLTLEGEELHAAVAASRARGTRRHLADLTEALGVASAYVLGYPDSPLELRRDSAAEGRLLSAKLVLEDELLALLERLAPPDPDTPKTQIELVRSLRARIEDNRALRHPLFPFLGDEVDRAGLRFFLLSEVTRNEVVDDEVAMLPLGIQGAMKAAVVLNLADEVGVSKGLVSRLDQFHTTWLRELLVGLGAEDEIVSWRAGTPAFRLLTSVAFMALLTRPGLRLAGYGSFVMSESWVRHHFGYVLRAMDRQGLAPHDRYFRAHWGIDPHHTDELLDAIEVQEPVLTPQQVALVDFGARVMVAAKTLASDLMLEFLRGEEVTS